MRQGFSARASTNIFHVFPKQNTTNSNNSRNSTLSGSVVHTSETATALISLLRCLLTYPRNTTQRDQAGIQAISECFKATSFFEHYAPYLATPSALSAIANSIYLEHFPANASLVRINERVQHVWIVLEGELNLSISGNPGGIPPQIIGKSAIPPGFEGNCNSNNSLISSNQFGIGTKTLKPGEFYGDISVRRGTLSKFNVIASSPSICAAIPASILIDILPFSAAGVSQLSDDRLRSLNLLNILEVGSIEELVRTSREIAPTIDSVFYKQNDVALNEFFVILEGDVELDSDAAHRMHAECNKLEEITLHRTSARGTTAVPFGEESELNFNTKTSEKFTNETYEDSNEFFTRLSGGSTALSQQSKPSMIERRKKFWSQNFNLTPKKSMHSAVQSNGGSTNNNILESLIAEESAKKQAFLARGLMHQNPSSDTPIMNPTISARRNRANLNASAQFSTTSYASSLFSASQNHSQQQQLQQSQSQQSRHESPVRVSILSAGDIFGLESLQDNLFPTTTSNQTSQALLGGIQILSQFSKSPSVYAHSPLSVAARKASLSTSQISQACMNTSMTTTAKNTPRSVVSSTPRTSSLLQTSPSSTCINYPSKRELTAICKSAKCAVIAVDIAIMLAFVQSEGKVARLEKFMKREAFQQSKWRQHQIEVQVQAKLRKQNNKSLFLQQKQQQSFQSTTPQSKQQQQQQPYFSATTSSLNSSYFNLQAQGSHRNNNNTNMTSVAHSLFNTNYNTNNNNNNNTSNNNLSTSLISPDRHNHIASSLPSNSNSIQASAGSLKSKQNLNKLLLSSPVILSGQVGSPGRRQFFPTTMNTVGTIGGGSASNTPKNKSIINGGGTGTASAASSSPATRRLLLSQQRKLKPQSSFKASFEEFESDSISSSTELKQHSPLGSLPTTSNLSSHAGGASSLAMQSARSARIEEMLAALEQARKAEQIKEREIGMMCNSFEKSMKPFSSSFSASNLLATTKDRILSNIHPSTGTLINNNSSSNNYSPFFKSTATPVVSAAATTNTTPKAKSPIVSPRTFQRTTTLGMMLQFEDCKLNFDERSTSQQQQQPQQPQEFAGQRELESPLVVGSSSGVVNGESRLSLNSSSRNSHSDIPSLTTMGKQQSSSSSPKASRTVLGVNSASSPSSPSLVFSPKPPPLKKASVFLIQSMYNELLQEEEIEKKKQQQKINGNSSNSPTGNIERVMLDIRSEFYAKKYRKAYREAATVNAVQVKPSSYLIFDEAAALANGNGVVAAADQSNPVSPKISLGSPSSSDAKQKASAPSQSVNEKLLQLQKKHQLEKKFPESALAHKVNDYFKEQVAILESKHSVALKQIQMGKDIDVKQMCEKLTRKVVKQDRIRQNELAQAETNFNFIGFK